MTYPIFLNKNATQGFKITKKQK